MNKNIYYLKVEGTKEDVERMSKFISTVNGISIGDNLYQDLIEMISDECVDKYIKFNSLEPLFSKVNKDEIKYEIYEYIINQKSNIFNHLVELRKERIGI